MKNWIALTVLMCAQLIGTELVVCPEAGLVVNPISIRAEGLRPDSLVTLIARVGEDESCNVYAVDGDGCIDLSLQAPLEGSYESIDPMGPIWSIDRSGNFEFGVNDFEVTLSLCSEGELLAEQSVLRLLHEKTIRSEVREEGLVGTLFLPEGEGPFPGIVVLGGSEGGISERRSRLLASHGFAVFALGYFGAEGLPAKLQNIALEDVIAGVDWFRKRDDVSGDQVGSYGISRGGELVLLLGSLYPDRFAAICSVVPSSIALGSPDNPAWPAWTLAGEAVFPVPYPENESSKLPMRGTKEAPLETVHIIRGLLAQHPELAQAARIPVEEITCPVLLVSGGRDGLWPSSDFCHEMMPFLQRGEHLHFPDAGHAIGVPNLPTAQCFYISRADLWLSMGGSAARSQGASVFSWKAMDAFFSMFLEKSTL